MAESATTESADHLFGLRMPFGGLQEAADAIQVVEGEILDQICSIVSFEWRLRKEYEFVLTSIYCKLNSVLRLQIACDPPVQTKQII